MEDFKRPGTVLSLANTAYLIGGTILVYRKMNEFDSKLDGFSSLVNNTIKVTGELKTYGTQLEAIRSAMVNLNRELEAMKQENSRLRYERERQEDRIHAIIKALKENGIEVEERRPYERDYRERDYRERDYRERDYPPRDYPPRDYPPRDYPSPSYRRESPPSREPKVNISDLGF